MMPKRENECGKAKVMRISRQPSPVQIMIDRKDLENVEYCSYFGSVMTNGARCTGEIKSRTAMETAVLKKKKKKKKKKEEEEENEKKKEEEEEKEKKEEETEEGGGGGERRRRR